MDGQIVGLVAVIMVFGIPIAGMYTYYRVRRFAQRGTPGGTCTRAKRTDGA